MIRRNACDPWCKKCPTAIYNRCPRTPDFIEDCKKFSEEMMDLDSRRADQGARRRGEG